MPSLSVAMVSMLVGAAMAQPSWADTLQEVAAEGFDLPDTRGLAIVSEKVVLTLDTVTIRAELSAETPVTVDVALRLPPLDLSDPDASYALPTDDPVNFLDEHLTVDGLAVPLGFKQFAVLAGKDITKRLREARLPVFPRGSLKDKLAAVPPELLLRLVADGVLLPNGAAPDGAQNLVPAWTVRTVAIHRQSVEPGHPVTLEATSRTSVGMSQDTVLRKAVRQGAGLDEAAQQLRRDYCVDDALLGGVDKLAGSSANNVAGLGERRIAVRLPALGGPEGAATPFHLTIDKGKPDNLVTTCVSDLKKTGPTLFERDRPGVPVPSLVRVLILGRF